MKTSVHIVWFKRDLRVSDHAALYEACRLGAALPIFVWDKAVWTTDDCAAQHQRFVNECLVLLKSHLEKLGLTLYTFDCGIIEALDDIVQTYDIAQIHSHEETGNNASYTLDKTVAAWCLSKTVKWTEYPQNGVVRRLKNRDTWSAIWEKRMVAPQYAHPEHARLAILPTKLSKSNHDLSALAALDKPLRQKGGRDEAVKLLQTFLNGRASRYRSGISSPLSSENAGSRLSPYLTWGVLSMREVVQAIRAQKVRIEANAAIYPKGLLAGLVACESRLHWHCHFMQKLETEPAIEFKNLHSKFNHLRDETYQSEISQARLNAWKAGQTGWPLVDACMKMLSQTGWINFRMRAMLMSTASYLLWLHWRETGLHLAREFLDYEPGIHWSQVQMQSGTTGINTLRIYNPVKQAMNQDPEGLFVRKWLPALKNVPNTWIFEPWLMPASLQLAYGCKIGHDYPAPLVDLSEALKLAKLRFSQIKSNANSLNETHRIIKQHASRKNAVRVKTGTASKPKNKTSSKIDSGQKTLF